MFKIFNFNCYLCRNISINTFLLYSNFQRFLSDNFDVLKYISRFFAEIQQNTLQNDIKFFIQQKKGFSSKFEQQQQLK